VSKLIELFWGFWMCCDEICMQLSFFAACSVDAIKIRLRYDFRELELESKKVTRDKFSFIQFENLKLKKSLKFEFEKVIRI